MSRPVSETQLAGYASQKKAAGEFASKLMIGLPLHKGEWRGTTLDEHLKWSYRMEK